MRFAPRSRGGGYDRGAIERSKNDRLPAIFSPVAEFAEETEASRREYRAVGAAWLTNSPDAESGSEGTAFITIRPPFVRIHAIFVREMQPICGNNRMQLFIQLIERGYWLNWN